MYVEYCADNVYDGVIRQAELAEARSQLLELRRSQAIGTPVGSSGPPRVPPLVRIPNDVTMSMVDSARDGWAAPATVETLLPKIVALWQELSVPLLHRSRFYQAFRGRCEPRIGLIVLAGCPRRGSFVVIERRPAR